MKLRNINLNGDLDKLRDAESTFKQTVAKLQSICDHAFLAEDEYVSPPLRICMCCGMTEVGWGVGYVKLVHNDKVLGVPRISTDNIYKLRQGISLDQDKKSRLLRSEVSMKQLIKEWLDE